MRIVHDQDAGVREWASPRLADVDSSGPTLGVMDQATGDIVAAIVFYDYRGHDISVGCVADTPRWAHRGAFRAIAQYVFGQLNCRRMTLRTAEGNQRARRMVEWLGFVQEGRHMHGMADGSATITYGMLREDCRWL